ncbi:Diphthamide biosynthesis protein 2 [Binucleata daphniae]
MQNDDMAAEIEKAIKRGAKLKKKDICALPALESNSITKILLKVYSDNDTIRFKEMIKDIQMFVTKNPLEDKLRFLFKLFDGDKDGVITNAELFEMLNMLCEDRLESYKIQNIVDQTMREVNSDCISYKHFKELITKRTKNIETYFVAKK